MRFFKGDLWGYNNEEISVRVRLGENCDLFEFWTKGCFVQRLEKRKLE